jgi:hypothetical protein
MNSKTQLSCLSRCICGALLLGCLGAKAGTTLTITSTNTGVALCWQGPGVLQSALVVKGSWADVPKAVASTTASSSGTAAFFRVREPLSKVVDTGVAKSYNSAGVIAPPSSSQAYYGQDSQYAGPSPAYTNNGDGTITDLNTGLMWVQARGAKVTWNAAVAGAATNRTGGYSDWRMPTIKELFSLSLFSGANGTSLTSSAGYIPFLDTNYFGFAFGPGTGTGVGQRIIDCQDWSATKYVTNVMGNVVAVFGFNFGDGRIKGYNQYAAGGENALYVRYVRGNPAYGTNQFVNNGDGTITDLATASMWSQNDSGVGYDWPGALAWVQAKNATNYHGYNDWRLPNVKELQSIVDYTRSPATTGTPAINTNYFNSTGITNEAGQADFPYIWSSTILIDGGPSPTGNYVSFGRAMGYWNSAWVDVHGAGSMKADPLTGNPASYPNGRGPQGDAVRIYNFVRLVRGGLN